MRQLSPNHEIGSQIALTTFHLGSTGFISFILIYDANFTVPNAVKFTYELDSKDSVIEAAQYPWQAILDAFKNSKELPWPSTAEDLDYFPPLPPKSQVFWNMWYQVLTVLNSLSMQSALSCQLAKISAMENWMRNGSCLNIFWQPQFVTVVRSLWQSSID